MATQGIKRLKINGNKKQHSGNTDDANSNVASGNMNKDSNFNSQLFQRKKKRKLDEQQTEHISE